MTAVQADYAYNNNAGTAGDIRVCIIDSGIDGAGGDVALRHEDHNWANISGTDTPRSRRRGAGGGNLQWNVDDCGHGSHVAGTIAAANNSVGVVGVAPFALANIDLHIVRVFEGADCGWTYASSLVSALDLCVAAGANVVNMSLGGADESSTERKAFDKALADGVLSIAAAGNEHDDEAYPSGITPYSFPASYASVVSVAATDIKDKVASFSNRNDRVEVSGPGVDVVSTVPMGSGSDATLNNDTTSTDIPAAGMDGAANGSVTGNLIDCGDGQATCQGAAGAVCLIERGTISFAAKATACADGNGVGVVIYNNLENSTTGDQIVHGTYGGEATLTGVGISRNAGLALKAGSLGDSMSLSLSATNYSSYNGTSMASPHVAGVAALAWSHNPNCTAAQVRQVLSSSAKLLSGGTEPNKYGAGLVQAADATAALLALNCAPPPAPECTTDAECTGNGGSDVCNSGTCEPGSTGSGPNDCGLGQLDQTTGCSCTANSECYFGKCKGKPGSKTCN